MEDILRILEEDARATPERIATMTGRDVDEVRIGDLLPVDVEAHNPLAAPDGGLHHHPTGRFNRSARIVRGVLRGSAEYKTGREGEKGLQ